MDTRGHKFSGRRCSIATLFKLHRGYISQGSVASLTAVEYFNVFSYLATGFRSRRINVAMDPLRFQLPEETFLARIVPAVTLATYTTNYSATLENRLICTGGILHALIAMVKQSHRTNSGIAYVVDGTSTVQAERNFSARSKGGTREIRISIRSTSAKGNRVAPFHIIKLLINHIADPGDWSAIWFEIAMTRKGAFYETKTALQCLKQHTQHCHFT